MSVLPRRPTANTCVAAESQYMFLWWDWHSSSSSSCCISAGQTICNSLYFLNVPTNRSLTPSMKLAPEDGVNTNRWGKENPQQVVPQPRPASRADAITSRLARSGEPEVERGVKPRRGNIITLRKRVAALFHSGGAGNNWFQSSRLE